jgi:hypothetical protein
MIKNYTACHVRRNMRLINFITEFQGTGDRAWGVREGNTSGSFNLLKKCIQLFANTWTISIHPDSTYFYFSLLYRMAKIFQFHRHSQHFFAVPFFLEKNMCDKKVENLMLSTFEHIKNVITYRAQKKYHDSEDNFDKQASSLWSVKGDSLLWAWIENKCQTLLDF